MNEYENEVLIYKQQIWKFCVWKSGFEADINITVTEILAGSLYSRKYFNDTYKSSAVEMTKYILTSFYEMIRKSNWMDNTSKQNAMKKLDRMGQIIAYSDKQKTKH